MDRPPCVDHRPKLKTKSDFSKDLSGGNSNTSKDKLSGDSGVERRSVGSPCSIGSMEPPPYMSPAPLLKIRTDLDLYSVGNCNTSKEEVAERANILKIPPKDEFGVNSGVERRSVASSCSIGSMDPPPNMSPDPISDVEFFSTKTAGRCDTGDSGFKETPCGSFTTGSCADASMDGPPDMAPLRPRGPRSVSSTASSDVYSVGDSGAEEFKHPDQGINVAYEMQSPITPHCGADSLDSVSERPVLQKPALPAADVCTSSNTNKAKKTWSRIAALLKSGKLFKLTEKPLVYRNQKSL